MPTRRDRSSGRSTPRAPNPAESPPEPRSPGADSASPRILQLARTVARRSPADAAQPLAGFIESIAKASSRAQRKIGKAVDAWTEHIPPDLNEQSRIDAVRGGTLHVVVSSSPALWAIDRLLRSGLEATIVAAIGPPVRAVRLRIGSVDPTGDAPDPRRVERWGDGT